LSLAASRLDVLDRSLDLRDECLAQAARCAGR
jgi:hypothetical protein